MPDHPLLRWAGLLVVTGVLVACAADPAPAPGTDRRVALGAATDPTISLQEGVDEVEAQLGTHLDVATRFLSFAAGENRWRAVLAELAEQASQGRTALLTWEPFDPTTPDDDPFPLADVAAGRFDPYLRAVLAELATFTGPVALRFAHEMNGRWYPWAGDPAAHTAAWDHLRELQREVAPAVAMVWSVNAEDVPATNRLEPYFPGADQVDVVALDAYNCLPAWSSPADLVRPAHDRLTALAPGAPVWITEIATCEADPSVAGSAGHTKAEWIGRLVDVLADLPAVTALVWFDRDKERDWRFASSTAAESAARAAALELRAGP